MILAQFCPSSDDNHPYKEDRIKGGIGPLETKMTTALASHVIEAEALSVQQKLNTRHVIRLRRLILCGLAASMALATLAPIVVLAG
jgi:hypothetical protein